MSTVFAGVVGAMVSKLQEGTPVAEATFRARIRPLKKTLASAVVVRIVAADVDRATGQSAASIWTTEVAVECYARATDALEVDEAVDALLEAVYGRLMTDPSLGGVIGGLAATGLKYEFDNEADALACATLLLQVRHASGAYSLTN